MTKVGIFGGSGLYSIEGIEIREEASLMTPYGEPSCNFIQGKLEDTEVVFLPRHGKGHRISPSEINYRANLYGMKKLGVNAIISVTACGSLRENMKPMDFVIPDQFVDRTHKRESSFFTDGIVGHVAMAEPFSSEIRRILINCIKDLGVGVHDRGTYMNMEGPQFSTKAESNLYRQWGMDIIGMTNATEAKLAREIGIAYGTMAMVTDYDCWHESHESVTLEMILGYLNKNVDNAREILKMAIPQVGSVDKFEAATAADCAVVTAKEFIPDEKKKEFNIG